MKKIELRIDYNYPPLFSEEGMISPENIGVSKKIIEKMKKWINIGNKGIDLNYPLEGGYKGQDKDIDKMGREIWKELIKEIGDKYEVWYWSNIEDKLLSPEEIKET